MKILLATDGSACSDAAVAEVRDRPWPVGSAVKVLSVIDLPLLPTPETWALPQSYYAQLEKTGKEQAQAAVSAAETQVRGKHGAALEIISQISEGHTVAVILDEAEGWGADLIVLGSHGYRGLQRFLLGSVSSAVVAHADCSVEIVRCRPVQPS